MSAKAQTPPLKAAQQAISAEVRATIARTGRSHQSIYDALGQSQSWFSRRYNGKTPWSADELLAIMNIIDEDITRVYAAGALAMQEARKTNPCLSDSDYVGSESNGIWAQRGYDMARRIFVTRGSDLDSLVGVA